MEEQLGVSTQLNPTQSKVLSWKDVRELSQTKDVKEVKEEVFKEYKNVGTSRHGDLCLYVLNSPQMLAETTVSDDKRSFAQVNRDFRKGSQLECRDQLDQLVEQTVNSLGSGSFVYDHNNKTIEHRFLRVARTLDYEDFAYLPSQKDKESKVTKVKMEAIPYGIMFQAVCVQGEWVLSSPNNCYLNDMTFGSNITLMEKFQELLKTNGFTLYSLQIDSVYTFILGCKEFSLIPLKKDYLLLRGVFTLVKDDKEDPLKKLRDSRYRPFVLPVEKRTYNKLNEILRSRRKRWFTQMIDSDIPINYFVLYHERIYQFSTPLLDKLWDYYLYVHNYNKLLSLDNDTQVDSFDAYMQKTLKTDKSLGQYLKDSYISPLAKSIKKPTSRHKNNSKMVQSQSTVQPVTQILNVNAEPFHPPEY